jgi:para-nitrobenzyl esterase
MAFCVRADALRRNARLGADRDAHGREDCLYLNVWRPEGAAADAPPAPVLFFIHGGGNAIGSTSEEAAPGVVTYDGAALATLTDAVVVTRRLSTRALRLAPTGSCRSPRTAGSRATTASWTRSPRSSGSHDNAAALEADAGRVMIFGESAGAVNVCMLLASPLAAGLFGAALMESGGCLATSRADAEAQAIEVATDLGCPRGQRPSLSRRDHRGGLAGDHRAAADRGSGGSGLGAHGGRSRAPRRPRGSDHPW